MPAFRPTRQWCYIIGGVLGFWVLLVVVGQLGWVPAGVLFEVFLVSTIALALAVGAAGMLAFMENKPGAGTADERGEEVERDGHHQDRDGQGADDSDAQ